MKSFRKTLALFLVLCMALSMGAFAAGDGGEPKTVTIGATYPRFVGIFDMAMITNDQISYPAQFLTFDTVLHMEVMEDGSSAYYSDILEDIYVDDAQEKLVMVLKPGVLFSNGEEMDGNDIVWSLQRRAATTRLAGEYAMFDFANAVVDGYTTTIPLNFYRGDWRFLLETAVVMNKDWVLEHGGEEDPSRASGEMFDWSDPALVCGSGPYKITEYVADDHVTFEKRDDWWEADTAGSDVAQPDIIVTKVYADGSTMMVDYQNGVLDAVMGLSETQYLQVQNDPSLGTAVMKSSNAVTHLVMDADNTPELADVELRRAIAMGTKTDDLAIVGYGVLCAPPLGMFAAESPFLTEGYMFEYDPETAAQMVKDLGYEGLSLPMICAADSAPMAEVWQEQMRQIGINIDLQVYDVMTCIQYWLTPGASAFMFTSDIANVTGDTSNLLSGLCETADLACWRKTDPEWNALVREGRDGATTEERRASYEKLEQMNLERAYAIPIAEWYDAFAYGANGVVKDIITVVPSTCNIRRIIIE